MLCRSFLQQYTWHLYGTALLIAVCTIASFQKANVQNGLDRMVQNSVQIDSFVSRFGGLQSGNRAGIGLCQRRAACNE